MAELAIAADSVEDLCSRLEQSGGANIDQKIAIVADLSWLLDRLHTLPFGNEGRVRGQVESSLFAVLRSFPKIASGSHDWVLIDFATKDSLKPPLGGNGCLVVDVSNFAAEGDHSASSVIVAAYQAGWKRVIAFDWRGQRFCGSGLGPHSDGFRLDVYGNPGDYLGSGLDGAEIYVHSSAQDQVAQIMKSGKLVIYGDVGQTFMYAAKGGEVYVLGNAAGRPLINAVGHPKVVINGTCLDYLAESFMAGDPLDGGGFAIVNGVRHHENGKLRDLATPYPGSNLFSLASGGAIYVRDPVGLLDAEQLNGGRLVGMTSADWQLIQSHLKENEELFGIRVNDLLKRGNDLTEPSKVYRKVEAVPLKTLAEVH
jgi:glutamate synthase domain-containing protein 3